MVIECEKCKTRFHLADGRISSKGARVRCSSCHHRFHVTPPAAGEPRRDPNEHSAPSQRSAVALPPGTPTFGDEPDLDHPEFLFDPPGPSTRTPGVTRKPEDPAAAAKRSKPLEFGGKPPQFASENPPLLRGEDEAGGPEPASRELLFEVDAPLLGAEAASDHTDAAPATLTAQVATPVDLLPDEDPHEAEDDMPMLEVERGAAGTTALHAADSSSFEDVLAKDLDDDDDDTMAGWARLGATASPSPAPASAPVREATTSRAKRSDNVLEAAHRSASRPRLQRPEPVAEQEFEPQARRRGRSVLHAIVLALGLVASAGSVRVIADHGMGEPPGPARVIGAGWTATEIEAFHAHDLSRRRVLVLRGMLSGGTAISAPIVSATLVDSDGRMIGRPVAGTLVRLSDEALTPEALSERLEHPLEAVEPGRDVDGFTVLVPDPPAEARRYYLELGARQG